MTIQEFIPKYKGASKVGNTPENKGECVGLVMVWAKDQGLPHVWGHAKDLLTNADRKAYEVIANTPDAIPQAGDIIVWRQGFNGTYGHTAIATGKATDKTFEVLEQNNPLGSPCRITTYKNYAYVDGWLRRKSAPAPAPVVTNTSEIAIKKQIIIDVYKALTGEFPNDDEIAARLAQNKNTIELIEDICHGDDRFFDKWIAPYMGKAFRTTPVETPPVSPKTPDISAAKTLDDYSLTELLLAALSKLKP